MTPRPFLLRLFLPFFFVMILIILVCGTVLYYASQRTVHMQQIRNLDHLTRFIRQGLADAPDPTSEQQQARLREAAKVLDTRITLIGGDGRPIFDSHARVPSMDDHNNRPEITAARQHGVGQSTRESDTVHNPMIYVAQLVDPRDPGGVVVRLSYPRRLWLELGMPTWMVLLAGGISAAIAMGILSGLLQRQWIAPTRRLALAAGEMAAGNWHVRVEPEGADDIRYFSSRLNIAAAQAQRQLADLLHQRADLRALVDTLPDPILVTDARRKLVLINTPTAKLLQISPEKALGQPFVGVVNDEAVLGLLDQLDQDSPAGAAPVSIQREIHVARAGQRFTYQGFATRTTDGGAMIVLRDVTQLASAVQMKTDFVANASHELRTPIAAIKIAFDTLREVYQEDPRQSERCVRIIDGHIRRLEEMLADLLDLSRVESPDLKPDLTEVKASSLHAMLRSTMGPVARRKQVELRLGDSDAAEDIVFHGDERLLNLILRNLVENAIKFTPENGSVTTAITREDGRILLRVIDTGIGIPPEHLDRVFERFYQVNVSRTGAAGRGTGLGLAIVKHAVAALGGTIHLDSVLNEGTTVTCVLPQSSP